jgi:hypothetical protein
MKIPPFGSRVFSLRTDESNSSAYREFAKAPNKETGAVTVPNMFNSRGFELRCALDNVPSIGVATLTS